LLSSVISGTLDGDRTGNLRHVQSTPVQYISNSSPAPRGLADGVYIGFKGSGAPWSPFAHAFIAFVNGGQQQVIEFGPVDGGYNDTTTYQSTLQNAASYAMVPIPANQTLAEQQTFLKLDAFYYSQAPELSKYSIFPGGDNCVSTMAALLSSEGSSYADLQSIQYSLNTKPTLTINFSNMSSQFLDHIKAQISAGKREYERQQGIGPMRGHDGGPKNVKTPGGVFADQGIPDDPGQWTDWK